MRAHLQRGLVLHHRAYRDTSMLLELCTQDYGRVGVVARGVRKEKARWPGLLQPFRPLLLSWSGRGELATLTGAEEDGPAFVLKGNALPCGFYLNELLLRLLQRNDPHAALYSVYHASLQTLAHTPAPDHAAHERALRIFEKRLLEELGYGLILDRDVGSNTPLDARRLYRYELERGPVAYNEGDAGAALVHGASLLALARHELSDAQCLHEIKRLMRTILPHYLGEKPLQSRALFIKAYERDDVRSDE